MSISRTVITVLVIIAGTASLTMAQSGAPNSTAENLRVSAESPAGTDKGTAPVTAPGARTETLKPTVEQEIEALKK